MNKTIEIDVFSKWKTNLQPTTDMPVWTTDALIKIKDLDDFLTEMKAKNADSVRINLVRFDWRNNEPQDIKEKDTGQPKGCKWHVENGKLTQVGIAISGAKGYVVDSNYMPSATDITENGNVTLLIPGDEEEGPIGHNPPSGSGTTGK